MMTRMKVSSAVAVAVVLVAVALLVVSGEATGGDCNVDEGKVMSCVAFCVPGSRYYAAKPRSECCKALAGADLPCLCRKYWSKVEFTRYADCAMAIPSKCGIQAAPKSCDGSH